MGYYKSTEDLYSEMTSKITTVDTSENSYIFNALNPCATQISTFSLALDEVLKQVFASTAYASGYSTYLERRASEVGLTRKMATYASIPVTFIGKVGIVISQGTVVSTADNRYYTTISDVTVGSDGTAIVDVLADKSGSTYNVNAGDINYLPVKLSGITSVTNPDKYNSAYDTESDAELYQRYLAKVQLPATSGNVAHYKEWCLSVTGVGDVQIYPLKDENFNPKNGHVTCVITNSNKEPASNELIQTVKDYIDPNDGTGEGQAPIGATVHILSVTSLPIDIKFNVQIDTSTTLDAVKTTLNSLVTSYLRDSTFKTKKVNITKIGSLILDISGVLDYSNLTINGITSNINLSETQVAMIGGIDIGVMN